MSKLKSEQITEKLLEILTEIQKLKSRYQDFADYVTIETHLKSAQKGIHELTLKIKNRDKC